MEWQILKTKEERSNGSERPWGALERNWIRNRRNLVLVPILYQVPSSAKFGMIIPSKEDTGRL